MEPVRKSFGPLSTITPQNNIDKTTKLTVNCTGWFGLAAAKTRLDHHPNDSIVVLDAESTVGGVWAQRRLYAELRTNNLWTHYEYPDFPMDEATFGVGPGQHIPGAVVHRYLTAYAKKFGVFSRIRFETKVETIARGEDGGWVLETRKGDEVTKLLAKKLVVATGLTSEPNMPEFKGQSEFGAPIVHSVDLAERTDLLKTAGKVVVLGGAKSMWDVAYAFATAGVQVDVVVRESGKGPVWMAPPYVTPLKLTIENLVNTRVLTWMSPCIWGDEDGYGGIRSWLHGARIGRWIVDRFWDILQGDLVTLNGYDSHPDLKSMRPWNHAFYVGTALSIFNYPTSVLDMVRQEKIRTHVANVDSLSSRTVHLSSGESLEADALFCATGWKHRSNIKWNGIEPADLGLPYRSSEAEPLAAKADAAIVSRFPRLKQQPKVITHDVGGLNHPYRLYRFMVPPSFIEDRSIAFAGLAHSLITSTMAPMQALWISAYLDGKLDRLPESEDEIRWQTMLHTQYNKLRHPTGNAARHPDFVFDGIPYMDLLLGDLGVENHRQPGRVAELIRPYLPENYRTVGDEWKEKHGDT